MTTKFIGFVLLATTRTSIATAVFVVCLSDSMPVRGDTLTFNPDTGTLNAGSGYSSSVVWNGVTITNGGIDGETGLRRYLVHGDFNVEGSDTVTATLNSTVGIQLVVGNDANIDPGATFNFSASEKAGRAGGGRGGVAGDGMTSSGSGGAGGDGGRADNSYSLNGSGGGGGIGGEHLSDGSFQVPTSGSRGRDGFSGFGGEDGASGRSGYSGESGTSGTSGFGGTAAGVSTSGGAGGTGGEGGDSSGWGGSGGYGGPGGSAGEVQNDPGEGGAYGRNGGNGYRGEDGTKGGTGQAGESGNGGKNDAALTSVSAGAGGSGGGGGGSGGGGGGGQGGGGGGHGGGGGGGGGAQFNADIDGFSVNFHHGGAGGAGGRGGNGDDGGDGGRGSSGARGGDGGDGGAGGGALEIRVLGKINAAGNFHAQGGNGVDGTSGNIFSGSVNQGEQGFDGNPGSNGYSGQSGYAHSGSGGGGGNSGLDFGYSGQDGIAGSDAANTGAGGGGGGGGGVGGDGGRGGNGAEGGDGGSGAGGGGGAGGTIKLFGSVLEGTPTIDTAGGIGGTRGDGFYRAESGQDGKLILGDNTTDAFVGTISNATQVDLGEGTREINPHFASGDATPNIPGLSGGAEAFGLTGLLSNDAQFSPILSSAPADSFAALHRLDTGPSGFDFNWDGYDMLLYMNLTGDSITDPKFGFGGSGFEGALKSGGFVNDSLFGGSGDQTLDSLDGFGVYATLIPENTTDFSLSGLGSLEAAATLDVGQSLFVSSVSELAPVESGTDVQGSTGGGIEMVGGVDFVLDEVTDGGTFSAESFETPINGLPQELLDDISFFVASVPVQVWDIDFDGTFTGVATLTFAYDDSSLILPETELVVFHLLPDDTSEVLPTIAHDLEANTITVETTSFSPFVLAAVPEPSTFSLAGIGLAFLGIATLRRRRMLRS